MKIKLITALIIAILLSITVGNTALAIKLNCSTCGSWQDATFLGYVYWDNRFHCEQYLCHVCNIVTEWGQTRHEASIAATCTERAYCDICKSYFGQTKPHNWKTVTADDTKHTVVCNDCSKTEIAAHESDATCTTVGTCNICKKSYKNPDNHAGPFTYVYTKSDENSHTGTQICTGCEKPTGKTTLEKHTETKKATCTTAAYCGVCESNYGNPDTKAHDVEHHKAKAATCLEKGWTAYDTCKRAGCGYTTYQELPVLDHDIERHEGKAATCLEKGWKAYETCKREGCNYTTYQEISALGHNYRQTIVKPTCEANGYTLYTCVCCEDTYTDAIVPRRAHWYGEWTPVEESAHEAACRREGCGFAASVDCEIIACMLTPDGQEEPLALSLCPVCGRIEGGESLLLKNVTAAALKGSLPAGEVLARLFTLKNGEKLLAVGFELGGRLVKADCPVRITLPVEAVAGYSFSLIESDGTLTALDLTVDGEQAAFELDFTDAESPAVLIRLVPAA